MRKGLFIFACILAALYWALHLALGSSPVQQRVLDEIKKGLAGYGFNLKIESIEFSAFAPRIYLNKVTVSSTEKAEIQLDVPVTVDKVKIQFSPFGLLYRKVIINETALYNPKLILPRADRLYRKVKQLLKNQEPIEMEGGNFTVVVEKVGVVDALFNVVSADPPFAVRSRSLTAFLVNDVENQKNVSVQTVDLEIDRKKLALVLNKVGLDLDLSPSSVRLNQALLEGEDLFVDIRGTMALPKKKQSLPETVNLSYELSLPLDVLNNIEELGTPQLAGNLASTGNVSLEDRKYAGAGKMRYENVSVDGYAIENGELGFSLKDRNVLLDSVDLRWADGILSSDRLNVTLAEPLTIEGPLRTRGLRLGKLLDNVNAKEAGVDLQIDTSLQLKGQLSSPFKIEAELKGNVSNLAVEGAAESKRPALSFEKGKVNGKLIFFADRMEFQGLVEALQGKAHTEGYLGFVGNNAKLRVRGEQLSLTELGHIADLQVGGRANLLVDIDVQDGRGNISGSLDIEEAEIADLYLGSVKGLAQYQNSLLSFEDLNLKTSLDPVNASGFVDFRSEDTHYKFRIQGRRVTTNEVFEIFRKDPLKFSAPKDGEVSAMVNIEGGKDGEEMKLTASGEGRNFKWYGERWRAAKFNFSYRPDYFDLKKVVLFKRSGALDISAEFNGKESTLEFASKGLRIEEIDWTGKAPLSGEIIGGLRLEGNFPNPTGSGSLRLVNANFRGEEIPDSSVIMQTNDNSVDINADLMGEKFKGSWTRSRTRKENWNLVLLFRDFDFAPLITMAMGKDIKTFTDVTASGDISLTGQLKDWKAMKGSGTISKLNLGLKGTPMTNRQPLEIKVNRGTVRVNQFNLVGRDGQLLVGLVYQPEQRVQASLDGKIDLQFLQPFIPGLESGTGTVSMGLRISGRPPRFDLLGNAVLENGRFRLEGLQDEFRSANVQLSLSQDRIDVDKFSAVVNGGNLSMQGDVRISDSQSLQPNLQLSANRIGLTIYESLRTRLTGDFRIQGNEPPYALSGNCLITEGKLSSLEVEPSIPTDEAPLFKFDIQCTGPKNLLVQTDAIAGEFKGDFRIVGDSNRTGLLGAADMLNGKLFFRQTAFDLSLGQVRFESKNRIAPRFDLAGIAVVKEKKTEIPQEYEVTIKVIGTPADYKILLSSTPALAESEIISLLVLGVTERTQEGNYVELGTALVSQVPIQQKLEEQLGVDINISQSEEGQTSTTPTPSADPTTDVTVPMVEIQKQIGKNTTLSYSNSISGSPVRKVEIEHELGENVTVNGSFLDKSQGTSETQTVQSYGLDFKYRFKFE